jgi:hypothetical protein
LASPSFFSASICEVVAQAATRSFACCLKTPTIASTTSNVPMVANYGSFTKLSFDLESLGFTRNFLSSCELEALHFIGMRSFGEEFREDMVVRRIQEKFGKPLA